MSDYSKEFQEAFSDELGMNTENIETDLMDLKESSKIKSLIGKLKLYKSNPEEITNIYTEILEDDNVAFILTRISQDRIFFEQFPEFYEKNEYGENIINCQQNSNYHKFGVFKHILTTIESVGNPQIPIGDWQKKILKWTMFLHDIGKPYVKTISEDGTESFAGHDDKSVELGKVILDRLYFTDEEKKIILTLVKYHDKYLNEGEITYDNMKFLANELENNKELFYLLIDVKDSDARAKSLEVYNKYKITKTKYIEFINSYFVYNEEREISVSSDTDTTEETSIDIADMQQSELDNLVDCVINRKCVTVLYQPVIDLKMKKVYGYEIFTKIETTKKVDVVEFLNYTKDVGKYDKVQQVLLVNGIDAFESVKTKEAKTLFVNSDLMSYQKYINKPRLYDMMGRNNIILELHNYDKKDLTVMQEIIDVIHENKGFVALDNFGSGSISIDDMNMIDVDYIVPDMALVKDIQTDTAKQKYLADLVTYSISKGSKVIVVGIENKESLDVIRKLGVRYVQGYYFQKPRESINIINGKLESMISTVSDDGVS
ncbi:MAG: EAL domain-containing protein [Clostridia bacterium]